MDSTPNVRIFNLQAVVLEGFWGMTACAAASIARLELPQQPHAVKEPCLGLHKIFHIWSGNHNNSLCIESIHVYGSSQN